MRDRVDIAYVAPRRRAYLGAHIGANRPNRLLLAGLCALCLCACVLASMALGSPAGASKLASGASNHSSSLAKHHRRGHSRKKSCARRSSFHAGGGPKRSKKHHSKRRSSCRRHHGKARHKAKHHATQHSAPASHSSSCQDADLRPTPDNLEAVRTATLCLVNRERTGNGESPLQPNGKLQQAAQEHSEDMAAGSYFEHTGRHGDTPLGRMRAAGYFPGGHIGYEVGENIGWGTLWLASPRSMVASWMGSPGHRANILDAHFHETGIGISPHPLSSLARGQAGGIYTQDFGVIF